MSGSSPTPGGFNIVVYLKSASGKSKTKIHFSIEIVTFIVTREAETIKLTISLLEGYRCVPKIGFGEIENSI